METRQTILVVDDLPENLDLVVGLLRDRYELQTAANGEEAVSLALETHPDLILLDIEMPVMDGFEACKRLKASAVTRDIPVIFLTAKDEPGDVIKGLKLGAADYVTKPFDARVLKARVDNIVELVDTVRTDAALKNHVRRLELVFPSLVKFVAQVRDYLNGCYRETCKAHGINLLNLDLCLSEALSNAIIHGNLDVDSSLKQDDWARFDALLNEREADPRYAEKTVAVRYEVDAFQIAIQIEDQGSGFDPNTLPDPNDPEAMLSSGRGILLIRSFMDEVSWSESGNEITLIKKIV